MKTLARLVFLAFLVAGTALPQATQTPPANQNSSLQGITVLQSNSQPVSKVYVDLRGAWSAQTTTEEDGKFYFPSVPPGQYHLYARREGYALSEYGQRWSGGPGLLINLTAGQPGPNVQLVLSPTSVISGHITDLNGLPVTGARVRAMKTTISENRRTLRVIQEAITDELGAYRLFWLAQGRYYVSATVQPWQVSSSVVNNPSAPIGDTSNSGLTATRSVSRPETTKPVGVGIADDEIYIPMYFPRTADGEQAAAIDLQGGTEFRGADISVLPVHTYKVRGRLTNLPAPNPNQPQGGPGGRAGAVPPLPAGGGGRGGPAGVAGAAGPTGPPVQVRLTPVNSLGNVYSASGNGETGELEFPKVVNGAYVLYTFIDGTTTRMPVEVRNGDVDGITMPLTTGVNLPVQIALEGDPPPNFPNLSGLRVMLYRDPTLIGAPAMNANAGGTSALPNLSPGDYRIYVQPILNPINGTEPPANQPQQWQGAYVKSIHLGDLDVLNNGLKYDPHPDDVLNVVIGINPGTLEGRVLNDQQQTIPSASVVLFAESPANRILRTDMFRISSTDAAGRFQVKGLPPGDYKVFAWENLDRDAWADPDFIRNEARGQSIHVDEGKTKSIDVSLISPH